MMETISWKQFYRNYLALSDDVPSLRLGQYFIIMFILDEHDDVLDGLWDQNDRVMAINQCMKVIDKYQWNVEALQIVDRGGARFNGLSLHNDYVTVNLNGVRLHQATNKQ